MLQPHLLGNHSFAALYASPRQHIRVLLTVLSPVQLIASASTLTDEVVAVVVMLQLAAKSFRWLQNQHSAIVPSELGVFEFLVLCFEQVEVAGAVINCFQAIDFDGGDAPIALPVVMDHVPQVLMVIFVLSLRRVGHETHSVGSAQRPVGLHVSYEILHKTTIPAAGAQDLLPVVRDAASSKFSRLGVKASDE